MTAQLQLFEQLCTLTTCCAQVPADIVAEAERQAKSAMAESDMED